VTEYTIHTEPPTLDLTDLSDFALDLVARERLEAARTAIGTEHFPVLMERLEEVHVEHQRRQDVLARQIADLRSIARATERSLDLTREALG